MRPGPTGEIQMAFAGVAKQLLQPVNTAALRLIVDIGTHQVVIARQVGIKGIAGHGDLMDELGREARIISA